MEEGKGIVCVTGGTGHVASWLIMRLLERGYAVQATVRSDPAGHNKDISYITNLPGAPKRLKIFNADLDKPDSFSDAISGCIAVFHVAHPMDVGGQEEEETVTKRAVEGLLGILTASLNSKTVKKVVYTSSAAAVMNSYSYKDLIEMDENTWSDIDFCRNVNKIVSPSYTVSKTVTEKAALEFAQKHGLDVVTVVLPTVVGPFITPNLPTSVYMTLAMIFGKQNGFKYIFYVNYLAHIDDAASAHIFLLELANAQGRYICCSAEMTMDEMHDFLSANYPELQLPTEEQLEMIKPYKQCSLSSKKLLDSGFKFQYGVNEMLAGAIKCCKEKGFL